LVQERTRLLRRLEFLRHLIIEIDGVARDLESRLKNSQDADLRAAVNTLDKLIERILQGIALMARPEAPYSALVSHWKKRFLAAIRVG
jgi:hypothetical protein